MSLERELSTCCLALEIDSNETAREAAVNATKELHLDFESLPPALRAVVSERQLDSESQSIQGNLTQKIPGLKSTKITALIEDFRSLCLDKRDTLYEVVTNVSLWRRVVDHTQCGPTRTWRGSMTSTTIDS
jgi:hypothetical protein